MTSSSYLMKDLGELKPEPCAKCETAVKGHRIYWTRNKKVYHEECFCEIYQELRNQHLLRWNRSIQNRLQDTTSTQMNKYSRICSRVSTEEAKQSNSKIQPAQQFKELQFAEELRMREEPIHKEPTVKRRRYEKRT
ncbi:uncharacterized protein LOC118194131 [Stegodyphus dumicola]|uniref:uncharacterized protein LOC118194131 n=1 Tax=Stegodyphus dumicola TaxID=202533 RepID=UPI0015AD7CE8|nr:uncharacterized protein LOC118194131 [Stegodyphus dumicola]